MIEILSPNDSLKKSQNKMQEYIDNGCRLGWLINRKQQDSGSRISEVQEK